jgi:hypothetical protein
MRIERIEVVALKKLAIVSAALATSLKDNRAANEQRALTRVLMEVINRAEAENAPCEPRDEQMEPE